MRYFSPFSLQTHWKQTVVLKTSKSLAIRHPDKQLCFRSPFNMFHTICPFKFPILGRFYMHDNSMDLFKTMRWLRSNGTPSYYSYLKEKCHLKSQDKATDWP